MSVKLKNYVVGRPVNQWIEPMSVDRPTTSVTLGPGDDPQAFIDQYDEIHLKPGETYRWCRVTANKPFRLIGHGATVQLFGVGPILRHYGDPAQSGQTVIRDVSFVDAAGTPARGEPFGEKLMDYIGLEFQDATQVTVQNCRFLNFRGTALWFYDTVPYTGFKWDMQHIVLGCRFRGCRIAISNGGGTEYSIASNNTFWDCQICFNTTGGNWNCSGNLIVNCRSGYFHSQNTWYAGPQGNKNAAHGSFVGNTVNHCDYGGCLWPTPFIQADGSTVQLAGFYFDDTLQRPPTWTGNTMYYCDTMIKNFLVNGTDTYCLTGCAIFGTAATAQDSGKIEVGDAVKDKVYLTGCTGNGVTLKNVKAANVVPTFGTVK